MKKLVTFSIMAVVLCALSAAAVVFNAERFNYPMGDLVANSGGIWHYWQGNPPAPVVTNLYPYGSSGTNLTLDDAWQEGLWFYNNVFESSTEAIVGFSFAAVSSINEDYYVFFCSGDAAAQDSGYADSGLGGFIINWVTPAAYTNVVSLHLWNAFGIYELSLSLPAALPGNTPPWHDVRAVMYKTMPGGITGGYARIYIDGVYLGNVPFPLQNLNNLTTNALNCVDLYQTTNVDPDNRSRVLIDNIFLESRQNYTRYVAPTGNDANDGLTPATPYQTIAQATWQIPSGADDRKSLINVAPGVYPNEYTIKSVTNNWKYGLYIRAGQVDRPNCYDVAVQGSGANNTIILQDFSTVPGITLLEQTMGFYIRDLKGWIIQDMQVQVTTNMPQDAWAWYYATVGTFMSCRDSSFIRCLATMPQDWAKGKSGYHLNGGGGLTLLGCASVGGGMGFNVAGGPQAPLTIASNTFVGAAKGTSEGNSGVAMVFNGGSGMVTRCIVANPQRGGVLGGLGDIVHSVENNYYNCGTNGTTYYDSGTIIVNNDVYRDPLLATYLGYPVSSPYLGYGWHYWPGELVNSSWPMAGRNKQRQGWYTNGTPLTVAGILWTNTSAMAADSIWGCGMRLGSTATDGQRIFAAVNPVAANNQATLLALNPQTGTTIWNAVLGGAGRFCYGTPAVGETMVYIAEVLDGPNQQVYGVNSVNGQIVWSNSVDTMNGSAMLLHNGKLYFDTDWNAAGLWCLNAMSGAVLWSNQFAGGNWGTSGMPLSPDGNTVYNHGDDGILHAVNANNGSTVWTAGPYEGGQGDTEPVVDNAGNVYCMYPGVTNDDPSAVLYKYAPDGSPLWSFRFYHETDDGGLAFSPDGNTLYVTIASTSADLGLFAFDPVTGAEKWRIAAGKCGGSPVVAAPGNRIIGVFEEAGTIWARGIQDNGASATILWSVSLGAPQDGWLSKTAMMRPAILANGNVMVQNPSGLIACIYNVPEPTLLLGMVAGLALWLRKR